MSIAEPYASASRAPWPGLQVVGARNPQFSSPYSALKSGVVTAPHAKFLVSIAPATSFSEADIGDDLVQYRATPNVRVDQPATAPKRKMYPAQISALSIIVLLGTIISALIGYFVPGLVTGAALPIFITLWWLLYRTIRRYDERQPT
jgi:hypothetical protein